jgi:P27 family predicted phage terminase small subunit
MKSSKPFAPPPPQGQVSVPRAPKGLTGEARSWWRKICSGWQLDDAGFLILQSGLECLMRVREAQAILLKEGIVVTDRFGQLKAHPATVVERDCKAGLLKALRALNLALEPLNEAAGRPPGS